MIWGELVVNLTCKTVLKIGSCNVVSCSCFKDSLCHCLCATGELGQELAFVRRNHGFDVISALLAKLSGHFLSSHE